MKKIVFVLLAAGSLSFAWSQGFYIGGGVSLLVALPDSPDMLLLPSVQLGGRVADDLDFRVTLDSDFTEAFIIGTDLLYVLGLEDPAFFYIGGGADLFIIRTIFFGTPTTWVIPSLHPTAGVELRLEPIAIFIEAQPQLIFLLGRAFVVKLRTGVNIRF